MKDVLTALTSEVFKPLMTVVLPGAVAISTATIGVLLRYQSLRAFAEWHRPEALVFLALLALIAGEIVEDLGSRVEYGFDCRLAKAKEEKSGLLKFPNFQMEWERYLIFDCERTKEPVGIRYIRALLLRMKFELGMLGGFLFCGMGLWSIAPLPTPWKLGLTALTLASCIYFLWEASESHELLASTRHLLFPPPPDKVSEQQKSVGA